MAAVLVSGCSGDVTESAEYRDLQSELSNRVADLGSVNESLFAEITEARAASVQAAAEAEVDLTLSRAEASDLEEQLSEARTNNQELSLAVGQLVGPVEQLIAQGLWINTDYYEYLVSSGFDVSVADQLLNRRGWGDTWSEFLDSGAAYGLNESTRFAAADKELNAAWQEYWNAESDDEEDVAFSVFLFRLWALMLDRLDEATSAM